MLLKGDPRWTHRRRLVYATVVLGTWMIVFGSVVFRSELVASELIRNGTILLGAVLSGYVFAATWDDKGRVDHEPSAAHLDSQDGSSDGDGVGC